MLAAAAFLGLFTLFLTSDPTAPSLTAEERARLDAEAVKLVKEATTLKGQGEFTAAKEKYDDLAAVRTKLFGKDDWRVTDARIEAEFVEKFGRLTEEERQQYGEAMELDRQEGVLYRDGKLREAIALREKSLAIRQKLMGPESPWAAMSLNNLGFLLSAQQDYAAALPCLQQALAIRKKVYGPNHPLVAESLSNLGMALRDQGNYAAARPLLEEAALVYKKTVGPEHPLTARNLTTLGVVLRGQGEYTAARARAEEALNLWQKIEPDKAGAAMALDALGMALDGQADYAAAEAKLRQALAIKKNVFGPEHSDTAETCQYLAMVLQHRGNRVAARTIAEQALAIRKKVLGPDDPQVVHSLSDLGYILACQGEYAAARRCYDEALAIGKKKHDGNDLITVAVLTNYGLLFQAEGDIAAERSFFEQALAVYQNKLGPQHPETATAHLNLASALWAHGELPAARKHLEESLAIRLKAYGPDHPAVAFSLNNLGFVLFAQGTRAEARSCLERSLAIKRKSFGPEHQETAYTMTNLAGLLAAEGDTAAAWMHLAKVVAIDADQTDRLLDVNAEQEHQQNVAERRWDFDMLMSLAVMMPNLSPDRTQALLNAVQGWKGMSGFALRQRREAILLSGNSAAQAKFAELGRVRQHAINLTLRGPGLEKPEIYRAALRELTEQEEKLERDISELVESYTVERRRQRASIADVAARLPEGSVLVEFVKYRRYDFQAKDLRQRRKEWRYAAVLLRRGSESIPQVAVVPLDECQPIDRVIHAWRNEAVAGNVDADADRRLREYAWEPLAKVLSPEAKHLIIAPDGELSLVPFEALRMADGRYLIERYQVSYLSNGRDLIPLPKLPGEQPSAAVVLADPDFDAIGESNERAAKPQAVREAMHFTRLPGFRSEAEAVAKAWRVAQPSTPLQNYTGAEAAEETLAKVKRPRLLYFITHGYFLEDLQPPRTPSMALRDFEIIALDTPRPPVAGAAGDARLRSGLALAGANQRANRIENGLSDGLLSARKVASLDLWQTELVVLSACETGLGEVRAGEGVLGLRRAFQLAGAQTVLASLWKVPDAETQQLMSRFFELWLSGKIGKAAALRQAQLELIAKLRKAGNPKSQTAAPLYWAGFICHGQPE
jgi:CHAT domain-containing protein/Tfp pilus assembly protein PilF